MLVMDSRTVLVLLVISISFGLMGSLAYSLMTASYFVETASGARVVVHGVDAIRSMVRIFGILGYVKTLAVMSLFLSVHVFIGGVTALVLRSRFARKVDESICRRSE